MADHSNIEWTDATWQPITGCSIVSPGCTNCYAMKLAGTRLRHHPSRAGLTMDSKAGPVWNGKVRFNEQWLTQPLGWKTPRRIFVCAHGDLFHESVPVEWIDRVFTIMALAQQHTFQVLTKRSARMRGYISRRHPREGCLHAIADAMLAIHPEAWRTCQPIRERWPLPNVWLGVSTERQHEADVRIPDLLHTPAAVRFISAEPLLGPIDLTEIPFELASDGTPGMTINALSGLAWCGDESVTGVIDQPDPKLDWIIAGGESGPGARPMHPDWARSLRDQCAAAGVPFFFKQWGEYASVSEVEGPGAHFHFDDGATVRRVGKKAAGRLLDSVEHNGMPSFERRFG